MQTECSAERSKFGRVEGRSVVAEFDGGALTSDAGGLLLGAADQRLGLVRRIARCFRDARDPRLVEHSVATLIGQRVFGIALGYEDLNDHDELRHDPLMAVLAGKLEARREDCAPVAGKSTLNRLELSRETPTKYRKIAHEPAAIEALFVDLLLEAHDRPPQQIILDLDATDDPLHGHQEGRFFHGYYDCYCYLPLYVFCGRHLLAAKLRPSNIDASAGSVEEVARIVAQIRRRWPRTRILLRADSGFAREALMAWCEMSQVDFVFGLARNARLVEEISVELLQAEAEASATGKPARRFKDFRYATLDSWSRRRRVVAKAEWTNGEANPRFIVTSLNKAETSARFLMRRSTAPAARWRTGSRNAKATCSPTEPRPQPCAPTSCGSGSPRSPMRSSALSGASVLPTPSSPKRLAAQSGSSSSSSQVSSGSARGALNSRSPQPVPTPTNGGWPPPASSQPPDASPRRRKNAAIQPTTHRRSPKDRPHPRKPRQGRARPHYSHCAIIVRSRKTKPLL